MKITNENGSKTTKIQNNLCTFNEFICKIEIDGIHAKVKSDSSIKFIVFLFVLYQSSFWWDLCN